MAARRARAAERLNGTPKRVEMGDLVDGAAPRRPGRRGGPPIGTTANGSHAVGQADDPAAARREPAAPASSSTSRSRGRRPPAAGSAWPGTPRTRGRPSECRRGRRPRRRSARAHRRSRRRRTVDRRRGTLASRSSLGVGPRPPPPRPAASARRSPLAVRVVHDDEHPRLLVLRAGRVGGGLEHGREVVSPTGSGVNDRQARWLQDQREQRVGGMGHAGADSTTREVPARTDTNRPLMRPGQR